MAGFLPTIHAAAWSVAASPFLIIGARGVVRIPRDHPRPRLLLASAGAFALVLSALKLHSVTGSCSPPTGTGLGAVLFGPAVMVVLGAIVLLFQALLLAHSGNELCDLAFAPGGGAMSRVTLVNRLLLAAVVIATPPLVLPLPAGVDEHFAGASPCRGARRTCGAVGGLKSPAFSVATVFTVDLPRARVGL